MGASRAAEPRLRALCLTRNSAGKQGLSRDLARDAPRPVPGVSGAVSNTRSAQRPTGDETMATDAAIQRARVLDQDASALQQRARALDESELQAIDAWWRAANYL